MSRPRIALTPVAVLALLLLPLFAAPVEAQQEPVVARLASYEGSLDVIRSGIPGTEMPGTRHLTERDLEDVIAFVESRRRGA